MSYIDYRFRKTMLKASVWLVVLIITFLSGVYAGTEVQKGYEAMYIGRVIEKEHTPERIEDGERYEEAYYIVVKDNHGELLRYKVSKEEYRQVEIKDLWKR